MRVHHWLSLARPSVFVLTDGSGRSGESRLHSTTRVLEPLRAMPGCIYGSLTDRDLYSALMDRDAHLFIRLAKQLAGAFVDQRIDYVVGDATEGYNPAHDVCRLIIDAATAIASCLQDRLIANFDVLLISEPGDHPAATLEGAVWLNLDSTAVSKKIEVALSYAEMSEEVNRILKTVGRNGLETECLRRAASDSPRPETWSPYYEQYGERQVKAGHYQQSICYREHVVPIARALTEYVRSFSSETTCAY
ncbi:MAG: hypothetical protein QOE77_3109 [Blastocatellia bacterium]|nr:hypothetical protein [Blastocatellia bacterium]